MSAKIKVLCHPKINLFYSKLPSYVSSNWKSLFFLQDLLLVMFSLTVYHMCAATQEYSLELELEVVVSHHCEWWELNSGSV